MRASLRGGPLSDGFTTEGARVDGAEADRSLAPCCLVGSQGERRVWGRWVAGRRVSARLR